MPTYRNDSRSTVIVKNTEGADVPVQPGESVETYELVQGLTETSITPANEISVSSDPGVDVFTSGIKPNPKGYLNVSITGSDAIVTLQRSFNNGATWNDVWDTGLNQSGPVSEDNIIDHSKGVLYRIGIKNGEYSSGTISARLGW